MITDYVLPTKSWLYEIIKMHPECEDEIEKSVPRNHHDHDACRLMTNGDREGQFFLPHPESSIEFFFSLLETKR